MEAINARPSFCEWFDPQNLEHIKAYSYLQKTGMWPIGFKPEQIYMEIGWQGILAFKLANAWINYKLSDNNQSTGPGNPARDL